MFTRQSWKLFKTFGNVTKYFSSRVRNFKEVSIEVPWGKVSGKWWEPYDIRPILTLHGWQDNCGSFDRLIPLLNRNVGYLAIDLPGHGYSSRLPPGMVYHYSSYLVTILCVLDYFKWPTTSLMGHSMGGMMSYLYTLLFPKDVDFVICMDGSKPVIPNNKNILMGKRLGSFLKYNNQAFSLNEPHLYTKEEIVAKVSGPSSDMSILPEYAKYLIKRNVSPSKLHQGKFYFTRDPRLRSHDIYGFSQNELIQYTQDMKTPIFIAKFLSGSYFEAKEYFDEFLEVLKITNNDCDFHLVEGTHHAHLNNPEDFAELIVNFINKYYKEDRKIEDDC